MDSNDQQWQPCPPGELAKMVVARRARHRRKIIDRAGVVAAGIMACIAIGGFGLGLFTPDAEDGIHTMACSEVLPQLSAYVQGDLSEAARSDIAAHLHHCPSCRTRHEELLQSVSRAAIPGYFVFATAL